MPVEYLTILHSLNQFVYVGHKCCEIAFWSDVVVAISRSLATFRLQYEDAYEYEFSVLSTRFKFERRKLS